MSTGDAHPTPSAQRFAEEVGGFVARVCAVNEGAVAATADAVAATGKAGGLVRPAGAGHSAMPAMDAFYRSGGLAFVRPIWDRRTVLFEGARASTAAEREVGFGTSLATAAGIVPVDTVVVFSNSGVSPYPVEIAEVARHVGATVVAVTSPAAGAAATLRASRRLAEVADIVLDTLVPPGDVSWPPDSPAAAPLSSIANAVLWASVLSAVYDRAPDSPFWSSSHIPGGGERNETLISRFGPLIPEL
jgi:uncharacterized phosphosugar-binding protein